MRIEIFGQPYNLQGDDEAYIRELAGFVDEKMQRVAEATRTVDTARVAVLAALNIADELFSVRRERDDVSAPIRDRARRALALVEQALEESA